MKNNTWNLLFFSNRYIFVRRFIYAKESNFFDKWFNSISLHFFSNFFFSRFYLWGFLSYFSFFFFLWSLKSIFAGSSSIFPCPFFLFAPRFLSLFVLREEVRAKMREERWDKWRKRTVLTVLIHPIRTRKMFFKLSLKTFNAKTQRISARITEIHFPLTTQTFILAQSIKGIILNSVGTANLYGASNVCVRGEIQENVRRFPLPIVPLSLL